MLETGLDAAIFAGAFLDGTFGDAAFAAVASFRAGALAPAAGFRVAALALALVGALRLEVALRPLEACFEEAAFDGLLRTAPAFRTAAVRERALVFTDPAALEAPDSLALAGALPAVWPFFDFVSLVDITTFAPPLGTRHTKLTRLRRRHYPFPARQAGPTA